ncbi:uncharacterized protein B0H18DRAFT_1009552 [Fomitopsis serialis]|uniref:uncharacterized protein n=1 Tax=Fomitopsis serialis TaxID=139415 RepID=UPI0020083582|nr:uncharacterized protein B0H18DRAFT_1009552 [Neoantrodia serialis]KAH9925302.1 hypothetical protein B0H18DRAFT_1009552 [Neoantrodia serialis]
MSSTGAHLLSLKVMRVSRPSVSSAWEPFYSSSPSFSAHSTTSIVSLQGKTALPGHPKTLRDLSHVTEMLMLPSSFGAIQLGETFTSCISVNNEANIPVDAVTLTVEVQTTSTKTVLAEFGGEGQQMGPGESLEKVVSHEIKELGQHALACTVSYRLPPSARASTSADGSDSDALVFRKFYKFAVTNPLSVKTKVHVPRGPSAMLSRTEREKVFLEIHIQNLTQDAMWLERMHLECAEGWQVQDANMVDGEDDLGSESIFSGSMALMQPQDMRQYIYILSPAQLAIFPVSHQPGSILPLGRLDISWRSSFGEPGRLLTSMLSRRIPLIQAPVQPAPPPPPKQPVSAIPLHLQRSTSVAQPVPSRPRSPQLNQRPTSPPANVPYRSNSPFRSRTVPSPALPASAPPSTSVSAPARRPEDVEVDLVVRNIPRSSIRVDKPFTVSLTVNVASPVPVARPGEPRQSRFLSLAVQHTQPLRSVPVPLIAAAPALQNRTEPQSPRLASGMSTPSPFGTPQRADFQDFLAQKLLVASPRGTNTDDDDTQTETGMAGTPAPPGAPSHITKVILPPPFTEGPADGKRSSRTSHIVYQGSSALFLPQLRLAAPASASVISDSGESAPSHERNVSTSTVDSADSELQDMARSTSVRVVGSEDFELSYLPLRGGFAAFGGLRVLLIEDRIVDEGEAVWGGVQDHPQLRVLKEWDVLGEVWIES